MLSCNEKPETFVDIQFGKIPRKTFLKQMLNENTFAIQTVNSNQKIDTLGYSYNWIYKDKKYSMGVLLNEDYLTTKYNFGALRRMEFILGEGSKDYPSIVKFGGKISKKDVDELFNSFIDTYGKPDSLSIVTKYIPSLYAVNLGKVPKNKEIDTEYLAGKKAVWNKENFKLVFDIPAVKKSTTKNENIYYQNMNDSSVRIYYEMHSYNQEFKRIQDSIAKTLKPNDLVQIRTSGCNWSNSNNYSDNIRLRIDVPEITRKDIEEPRRIKAVRFDLIIMDSFKKEMYRSENLTIELPFGYYLESRPEKGNIGQRMYVDINKVFYVDFSSSSNPKLGELKEYAENNKLIVKADVKKILFEDGTILSAE